MDKYERRRKRLQELITQRFDGRQARFAEAIGKDANYVSRMLYQPGKPGKKRIGEDMCEIVERACHLTPGWLDMDLGTPVIPDGAVVAEGRATYAVVKPWPFTRVTAAQWDTLSTQERTVVEDVISVILNRRPTQPTGSDPVAAPQLARIK